MLGQGSTFTFRFEAGEVPRPVKTPHTDHAELTTAPALRLDGVKILLVEDSLDNQRLFSLYLRRAGATVVVAADGALGVKRATESTYDLVLMDLQMPVLDGHGATAALRAQGFRVPIVALSAHALKEEKDKALRNGFDYYLTKPVESELLIATILQHLST